ncbi:MAG: hypothetical protein ACLTYN_16720 [Dysosmobacter welbionis]
MSCYILADTFFVAQGLGTAGLAALNLAIPIYNFIHGTGLMLGMGGATKYSIHQSRGPGGASRMFTRHASSVRPLLHPLPPAGPVLLPWDHRPLGPTKLCLR